MPLLGTVRLLDGGCRSGNTSGAVASVALRSNDRHKSQVCSTEARHGSSIPAWSSPSTPISDVPATARSPLSATAAAFEVEHPASANSAALLAAPFHARSVERPGRRKAPQKVVAMTRSTPPIRYAFMPARLPRGSTSPFTSPRRCMRDRPAPAARRGPTGWPTAIRGQAPQPSCRRPARATTSTPAPRRQSTALALWLTSGESRS